MLKLQYLDLKFQLYTIFHTFSFTLSSLDCSCAPYLFVTRYQHVLFHIAADRNATVADDIGYSPGHVTWSSRFLRSG